jgi:hypothetical protein
MVAARVTSAVLWIAFMLLVAAIMFVLLRACGLVLPGYGVWHQVGFSYCARPARTAIDVRDARKLIDEARALQLQLLEAQAACLAQRAPQPVAPPSQVTPQPTPPPAPPQQAKPPEPAPQLTLPSAPTRDMSFIAGCWRTDPFRHTPDGAPGVSTYCFGADGRGRLEFLRPSRPGYACSTSASANFEGDGLRIRDSDTRCSDGTSWYADTLDCRRGTGEVAECSGSSSTPNGPHTWTVRLNRMK